MSSSISKQSTRSPISNVPYDVLLDIFFHCLPQHPLEVRQPNVTIAPMLLCQICSSWRNVALTYPALWSHLSYSFTVMNIHEELGSFAFFQNEIEFILWWKKNQGPIAPFLHLDIDIEYAKPSRPLLVGDGMAFVLKYVTTAQYLKIDPIFWERVQDRFEMGDDVTFPNLHTLVTRFSNYPIDHCFHATQVLIGLVPTYPPSALRRLAIVEDEVPSFRITIPSHWSALTHLLIITFCPDLSFWTSLTSAVPCLQWFYFSFDNLFDIEEYRIPSIQRSLPQLTALFIDGGGDDFLFSALLKDLHLPVLRTLWLSSHVKGWWNHRGITDVYTILQSTPAITKLTLRKNDQLSAAEIDYSTGILDTVGGVAPIWSRAVRLVDLQLELFITRDCGTSGAKELDTFVRSTFFSDNLWLDLDNAACPIKTITVNNHRVSAYYIVSNTHFTTSNTRKCVGNASNITFKAISEPDNEFAETWKEWDSRI